MNNNMRQKDIRPAPARIEFKGMKFLITDRPSDQTIQAYIMVSVVSEIYVNPHNHHHHQLRSNWIEGPKDATQGN